MAGALGHDFNRTMRSKSILISMLVIILLSLALVPIIKLASTTVFSGSGGTVVLTYYETSGGTPTQENFGSYHFLAYSYNTYGQPVIGTPINVTFTDQLGRHSSAEQTNSSGFASWAVPGIPETANPQAFSVEVGGATIQSGGIPITADGQVSTVAGYPLVNVVDPANSSRTDALFVWEDANGTAPTDYKIYYSFGATPGSSGGAVTVTAPSTENMTLLGDVTSYVTILKVPPPPVGATVTLGASPSNGGNALYESYTSSGFNIPPISPSGLFTSFTASILSLVVPLMAILVAYGSYGKDKSTGVLESVLTRPVTRRGLALSRYVSLVLAISVALLVTMGVMEVISQVLIGSILAPSFAVYTVASLIIEAAAFIGIFMLISHVLRTSGSLIGVGVGLWIVLDFFWSIIILIVAVAVGVQIGSGNYLGVTINISYFNPAQYYSLVADYVNGVSTSSGVPISPATYGLSAITVILAGALWVVVPLALLLYYTSRRD